MTKQYTEGEMLKAKADTIAILKSQLDELEGFQSEGATGNGYVVISESGLPLIYDVKVDGDYNFIKAQNPRVAPNALKATRFRIREAELVARMTIDGNGKPARSVQINRAVDEDADRLRAFLVFLAGV